MSLALIILASVLTIGTLAFKLQNNLRRWRRDDYGIKHGKEWVLIALANIPSITMLYQFKSYTIGAISISLVFFFLWLFFDGFYNVFRKFNWWYLGTNDGKKDAVSDRILRAVPLWLQIVIKLGGLISSLILYIILAYDKQETILRLIKGE